MLIAIIAIVFFILPQNKKEPVSPMVSQQPLVEIPLLSDCVYASAVQTESELNIDLNKSDIFEGMYVFLKTLSKQKEMRVLGIRINKEKETLNLKDLCSEFDIDIPDEIAKKIAEHYTLTGFFSPAASHMTGISIPQFKNKEWELESMGLILETKSGEEKIIKENLKNWERTMAEDVISLVLMEDRGKLSFDEKEESEFQDGNYKGVAIRYRKLPSDWNGKAINYIFTDDKIFITVSKESIYAIIDSLE